MLFKATQLILYSLRDLLNLYFTPPDPALGVSHWRPSNHSIRQSLYPLGAYNRARKWKGNDRVCARVFSSGTKGCKENKSKSMNEWTQELKIKKLSPRCRRGPLSCYKVTHWWLRPVIPDTQKVEAGRSWVQGLLGLQSKCKFLLGNIVRPGFKIKNRPRIVSVVQW